MPHVGSLRLRSRPSTAAAMTTAIWLGCGAAGFAATPPNERSTVRLLDMAAPGSKAHETPHFQVAYDTDYAVLRALVGRLEGTYKAVFGFCEKSKLEVTPPTRRLQVILFDRYDDYGRYAAGAHVDVATTAGFFDQRTNVAAFCNAHNQPGFIAVGRAIDETRAMLRKLPASSTKRRRELQARLAKLAGRRDAAVERFNRLILQHEATHQILFNIGVHVRGLRNPGWLVEGLACQFEVPQGLAVSGRLLTNHSRLADLREAVGIDRAVRSVSRDRVALALASDRLVRLPELVGNAAIFDERNKNIGVRYAQAWSLVFFLHREHRKAFAGYLDVLSSRTPDKPPDRAREIADFEAKFGPIDSEFERRWMAFVLRLPLDRSEAG